MEYIWFLLAIVGILLIQFIRADRSQKIALTARLESQWGQVPDREYMDGDLRRISQYYHRCHEQDPHKQILDDITWNDLGLDDIYMLINHTQSAVGEEALYRMLRMPETDHHVLLERDRLAQLFAQDADLRMALEKCLSQMGKQKQQAFSEYISELGSQPCCSNLRHYLGLAALLISLGIMTILPYHGGLLLIVTLAFQIITYYQQKAQVEHYFVCVANVVRLAQCAREICQLQEKAGKKSTADGSGIASYCAVLQRTTVTLEPIRRKAQIIATGKAMGGSPLDLLADYVKMLLHSDLIAYNQIIHYLREAEPAIWETIETVGQLECGLAIASFRQCLGQWCLPELSNEMSRRYLYGEELYHPLVDHAVPNSIRGDRCQLITGSNASGKSTFLKTVALSAVLAQTIYTVPGKGYQAPFYQIYSSMALKDDLVGGESYYMVEIRSLKRILDHGQDALPVLCFVDEVLRGTNTVERIAASTQILRSMSQQNILCFAATHDGELTYLLEEYYENGHFSETITEGDILFSYRYQPGRAVGRNALQLLGLMGYDEDVLEQARKMAERFDRTGMWSMYDEG